MLDFKEGDPRAFRILFDKYKKKIMNYCYRFCSDIGIAEELSQEVFFRVYKAAYRYRPEARFSTWIFRIATNVCLNEIRKARYQTAIESFEKPLDIGHGEMKREYEDPQVPQMSKYLEEIPFLLNQ